MVTSCPKPKVLGLRRNPVEYFRHRHREVAKPPWRSISNIRDLPMDCFASLAMTYRKRSTGSGMRRFPLDALRGAAGDQPCFR